MTEIATMIEPRVRVEQLLGTDVAQGPLLAAAMAAVLVDYRRYLRQQNSQPHPDSSRTNWRMVSRLEQLRGQA
jgi:hypothetical protein